MKSYESFEKKNIAYCYWRYRLLQSPLDLIRRLQEAKVEIDCILTQNAKEFVNIITFESLLGKQICSNIFDLDQEKNMNHIKLANECDAIIVVPCTANFVSKISTGTADDLSHECFISINKIKDNCSSHEY